MCMINFEKLFGSRKSQPEYSLEATDPNSPKFCVDDYRAMLKAEHASSDQGFDAEVEKRKLEKEIVEKTTEAVRRHGAYMELRRSALKEENSRDGITQYELMRDIATVYVLDPERVSAKAYEHAIPSNDPSDAPETVLQSFEEVLSLPASNKQYLAKKTVELPLCDDEPTFYKDVKFVNYSAHSVTTDSVLHARYDTTRPTLVGVELNEIDERRARGLMEQRGAKQV